MPRQHPQGFRRCRVLCALCRVKTSKHGPPPLRTTSDSKGSPPKSTKTTSAAKNKPKTTGSARVQGTYLQRSSSIHTSHRATTTNLAVTPRRRKQPSANTQPKEAVKA